ncbi:melanocyte-stimulating hormone receptor-like [Oculina patagonica]
MSNNSIQPGPLCDPAMAVHLNSSQFYTMISVVSGINIPLALTATLGNALILVALCRDSSLNPPSKLFLRCLALSDLCVGLIVQPVTVVFLLSAVYHRWRLCRVAEILWYSMSILMGGFSLAVLTAISVDRLLALLLGIRYRHVVTMKRARLLVALFLLISIVSCVLQYTDIFDFLVTVMWLLCLITSTFCYVRIYFALRNHIQVHVNLQGQPNAISPLNLSRYKTTVSTAMWLFAALIICYAPFGLVLVVSATQSELNESLNITTFFALTLVYLNSSLNPMLYCWKIRELRNAVKEIHRNLGFCKLC